MNSHRTNDGKDKSLGDSLDQVSRAYDSLDKDTPPEMLDQAILNKARLAVDRKSHWMQFGWPHGLTTAAVFVLAFSLVLNQREPAVEYQAVPGIDDELPLQEVSRLDEQPVESLQASPEEPDTEKPGTEKKARQENQQDMLRTMPVSQAIGASDKDRVAADEEEARHDQPHQEEAGLMLDTLPASPVSGQVQTEVIGEPASSELRIREKADTTPEQELELIMALKSAGDESWKTRLESFVETYPHYPLPDELKN